MTNRVGILDIARAIGNQTVRNGIKEDWVVTHEGVELFKLPSTITEEQYFEVRNAFQLMMERTYDEGYAQAMKVGNGQLQRVIMNGDVKLESLKQENLRLSALIEAIHGEELEVA